jgi:carbon monoxide dehydrogenase subunit G
MAAHREPPPVGTRSVRRRTAAASGSFTAAEVAAHRPSNGPRPARCDNPAMAAGPATPRLPADAVERRLFVDAPPAAVWLALHDPDRATAIDGLVALDPAGPDWPAAGARRTGRLRLGPLPIGAELESLEARPARRFRVGIAGNAIAGERRWELAPAAGGTRVACAVHLEGRSRIGRAVLRLERRAIGPRLEAELAALKRIAEAGPDRAS